MKTSKLNLLVLILSMAFAISACTEDGTLSELQDDLIQDGTLGTSDPLVANIAPGLVDQWTSLLLELERYAEGMRPNASARALAYIHLAAYETAVPGMPNYISNDDRLRGFDIRGSRLPDEVDWQIALNACYADVLDHFLLNITDGRKSAIGILESQLETSLAAEIADNVVDDSKEWGAYVAQQVIRYSQTDDEAEAQRMNANGAQKLP